MDTPRPLPELVLIYDPEDPYAIAVVTPATRAELHLIAAAMAQCTLRGFLLHDFLTSDGIYSTCSRLRTRRIDIRMSGGRLRLRNPATLARRRQVPLFPPQRPQPAH